MRNSIATILCLASGLYSVGAETLSPAVATDNAPLPLEFRAVLEEKSGPLFSVYETDSKRSLWVELNRPANGIIAQKYHARNKRLTVDYLGRSFTLFLQGSTGFGSSNSPAALLSKQSAKTADGSEFHDRPFRIGHVREEVEIRRAVRTQIDLPLAAVVSSLSASTP